MSSQELGKGQPCSFRLAVPKTVIKCSNCLYGETATAHRSARPNKLRPQSSNVVRIFPDQIRSDFACMGKKSRTAGALGIAKSHAPVPVGRLCLDKKKSNFRKGLLPAG